MSERQARATKPGSLWPREHGAYAQLALPLVTSLGIAAPNMAAIGFALTATSGFLAHEPALVVLGRRGARARQELLVPARRRLVFLAALGALGAALGLRGAHMPTLIACAAVAVLVGIAGISISFKREKTLPGELLAAVALSAASVPGALASGTPPMVAIINAGAWVAIFALGTLTVHSVLSRAKARATVLPAAAGALAIALSTLAVLAASILDAMWPVALLPPTLATLAVLLLRTTPKHLRRIGWSMVAADVVALVLLVYGLHGVSGEDLRASSVSLVSQSLSVVQQAAWPHESRNEAARADRATPSACARSSWRQP
jgi:hypothetical protein